MEPSGDILGELCEQAENCGNGEGYFSHPGLTSWLFAVGSLRFAGQPKGLSLRGPRVAALGFAFAGRGHLH